MVYKSSIDEMRILAAKKNGKCLSNEYKGVSNKLLWECSKGHQWESLPTSIRKHWCPVCGHISAWNKRKRYNISDMQNLAQNRNGICLSVQYLGYDKNLEWKCSDGHRWSAPPDRIFRGSWCPKCSKCKHFTEEKCRYIIEKMTGLEFPSNRVVLGGGLEIDLYNADLKIGIEYNGIQHYKFVKGWHKTLEGLSKGQERDRIKQNKCKKLGISLHVVSYKDSKADELLVSVLRDIADSHQLMTKKKKINFNGFYKNLSSLSDLKKMVTNNGGKCLSKQYVNCETKCEFLCKHGHRFKMEPRHVKAGHWCNKCGNKSIGDKNRKLTIKDAQKAAFTRGGVCLSVVYNSSNVKMKWKCSKGHVWQSSFNRIRSGDWCRLCGYIKAGNKQKSTLESVQKVANKMGGECLSHEYINGRTKLKFKCAIGHQWLARPDNIKSGKWCPKCRHSRLRA